MRFHRAPAFLIALVVLTAAPAVAQGTPTVVWVVRHAETAEGAAEDPPLSAEGEARADRLARMLAGAGITAVHTTPFARTTGTAGAVARTLGLTPNVYDPARLPAFADSLKRAGGRHLVVGHSDTSPALVRLLGGDPGGAIPESEYGRVYQLTISGNEVTTAILGYPGGFLAAPPPRGDTPPAAAPDDVSSVDAIVAALYDVISGPAGEARDWDRMRSLFLPTARMVPVQRTPDGRVAYRALDVEEYIAGSGPVLERLGFTEREIGRVVERFGDVAHVFSAYEGVAEGSPEPVARGVNSIQLVFDGGRWWVSSLAWSPERAGEPIPARYLRDRP